MICVLGISHKTASQDIRGKFSILADEINTLSEYFQKDIDIKEIVILSTCNRTEIYLYNEKNCCSSTADKLIQKFHKYKRLKEDYTSLFYQFTGLDAVNHLFKITSGLDSMVLGEDQIVKQVKEAYLNCTKLALTDAVLMRLFQKSFETGKKVRTDTNIQQGATSVSYVAADYCAEKHFDLSDKKVLFIGAGETGELALKNMHKKGVRDILICNRTIEKAEKLAATYGAKVVAFTELKNVLNDCDIIIAATGATSALIDYKDVESATSQGKEQIYIDLSVPRNIDKNIASLSGITLWAIDDLQQTVDNTAKMRQESIEHANQIIFQMVEEFDEWLKNRALRPIIKAIKSNFQRIKEEEIALTKNNVSDDFNEYAERLTDKLARNIIKNLKEVSKDGSTTQLLDKINYLFEIN